METLFTLFIVASVALLLYALQRLPVDLNQDGFRRAG